MTTATTPIDSPDHAVACLSAATVGEEIYITRDVMWLLQMQGIAHYTRSFVLRDDQALIYDFSPALECWSVRKVYINREQQ